MRYEIVTAMKMYIVVNWVMTLQVVINVSEVIIASIFT